MIAVEIEEVENLKIASDIAATILKELTQKVKEGVTTESLDNVAKEMLSDLKAISAPHYFYNFPKQTCISINEEVAHGIPSEKKVIKEGDMVNVDVSVVYNGFVSDNGATVYLGDNSELKNLCEVSKRALYKSIEIVKPGVKVNEIGRIIEQEAFKNGFKVIKNLCGHGVGTKLHEEPTEIPNYHDIFNKKKIKEGNVLAIETFVSTKSDYIKEKGKWVLIAEKGGYVAQYEHTVLVTEDGFEILTHKNGI